MKKFGLVSIALLAAAACSDTAGPNRLAPEAGARLSAAPAAPVAGAIPDEYIVVFKDDIANAAPGLGEATADVQGRRCAVRVSRRRSRLRVGHLTEVAAEATGDTIRIVSPLSKKIKRCRTSAPRRQPDGRHLGPRPHRPARPAAERHLHLHRHRRGVHAYIIDTGIRRPTPQFGGRAHGFDAIIDGDGRRHRLQRPWHARRRHRSAAPPTAWPRASTLHAVRVLDCAGSGIDVAGHRRHRLGHRQPRQARRSPT